MVLSDRDIKEEVRKGRIVIEPLAEGAIQPASVDLRLGRRFRVFKQHGQGYVEVKQDAAGLTEMVEIDEITPFYLHPGEFALGVTLERVELPDDIVGRLDGKSSLGRLGLVIHSTAGFVDPGWKGHLTLELSNLLPLPITLYAGMPVSQLSFMRMTTKVENPYGSKGLRSKYQGQAEPAPSRYHLNFQPPAAPRDRHHDEPPATQTALQQWLTKSQFQGSIRQFAEAIGVPAKTAEEWLYRGAAPSRANRKRLYALTGLPEFQIEAELSTEG